MVVGAILLRGASRWNAAHTEAWQQVSFFRHGANFWPLVTILNLSAGKHESVSSSRAMGGGRAAAGWGGGAGEAPPLHVGVIWPKLSVGRCDRRAMEIPALKVGCGGAHLQSQH